MRTIHIKKAQPPGEKGRVRSVTLILDETMPSFRDLFHADAAYTQDAQALEEALHATLPGGTYDRLAQLIVARKASHFVVSWAKFDDPRS